MSHIRETCRHFDINNIFRVKESKFFVTLIRKFVCQCQRIEKKKGYLFCLGHLHNWSKLTHMLKSYRTGHECIVFINKVQYERSLIMLLKPLKARITSMSSISSYFVTCLLLLHRTTWRYPRDNTFFKRKGQEARGYRKWKWSPHEWRHSQR